MVPSPGFLFFSPLYLLKIIRQKQRSLSRYQESAKSHPSWKLQDTAWSALINKQLWFAAALLSELLYRKWENCRKSPTNQNQEHIWYIWHQTLHLFWWKSDLKVSYVCFLIYSSPNVWYGMKPRHWTGYVRVWWFRRTRSMMLNSFIATVQNKNHVSDTKRCPGWCCAGNIMYVSPLAKTFRHCIH